MGPPSRRDFTLVELPAVSRRTSLVTGKGFTLVELLVVITIIILLISLLVPAIDSAIAAAMTAVCGTQETGIYKSSWNYATNHKGRFHSFERDSGGRWFTDGTATEETTDSFAPQSSLDPAGRRQIRSTDMRAYWGVRYTEGWGAMRPMFNCPAATKFDRRGINDTPPEAPENVAWDMGGKWKSYALSRWGGALNPKSAPKVWWGGLVDPSAGGANQAAEITQDSADGAYYDENDQKDRRPAKKFTQIYNLSGTIMFIDNMENMFESDDNLVYIGEWHAVTNPNGPDPTGYLEILRHQLGMNSAWGDGSVSYYKAPESVHGTPFPGGPMSWYTGGDADQQW
jgi:prepilin-type N-terminal cleavage/methylation domain-containing protein/prepilin-type processing-associated H-X9-DG protein